MNIHKIDTLEPELFNNLLATKKIEELKGERDNCFLVMIDDETFELETFKNNNEINIIENWFENIGQSFYLEDTKLLLTKEEINEVHNIIGCQIPIDRKKQITNDITKIKTYLKSKKHINELKLTYNNINKNIDGNINKNIDGNKITSKKINQIHETMLIPNYVEKLSAKIETRTFDTLKQKIKKSSLNYIGYNNSDYENNSLLNLGGLHKLQKKDEKTLIKYYIIYNEKYNGSFPITNPSNLELNILKNKKLGFNIYEEIEVCKDNKEFITILNTLISNKVHDNENEFKKRINTIKNLYKQSEDDLKEKSEFDFIKSFINNRYKINNDIQYKIKASKILNIIEDYLKYNISEFKTGKISFRNKLSKYLLELGLKKKRFTDGFYYYGLIHKNVSVREKFGTDINDKDILKKIINNRQNELNS